MRLVQYSPRSIRWQMVLVVSLVAAIIVATFGALLYRHMEAYRTKINRAQMAFTTRIAEELDYRILGAVTLLTSATSTLRDSSPGDGPANQSWLSDRPGARAAFFDCGLFLGGAGEHPVTVGDNNDIADNPQFRKWFEKPLTLLEPVISPPFRVTGPAGERIVLVIAVPVYNRADTASMVFAGCMTVDGSALLGGLKDIAIGDSRYFFVTSWDGLLIMHPDHSLLMRPDIHPIPAALLADGRQGRRGAVETVDHAGIPVLSTFTKMQSTGWVLGANEPLAQAYDTIYQFRSEAVLGLLFGMLFAGTVTLAMMRRVLAPIDRLAVQMDSIGISSDELLNPVQIPYGTAEVEILSAAFNRLIARINEDRVHATLATSVYENAREGIMVTDDAGRIVSVNRAFSEITGFTGKEALGCNPNILKSGRHDNAFYREMWATLITTGTWRGEVWNRRKNGEIFPELAHIGCVRDDSGALSHYMAIFSDISDIKSAQHKLETMATTDPLTGLPNRVLLADRLVHALALSNRRQSCLAVAVVDLDGFKQINDTHGHHVGDRMLIEIAQRFKDSQRATDTTARLGGDEFVLLLADIDDHACAGEILERVIETIGEPFEIEGKVVCVGASIGVTVYPDDNADADTLMRHADQAMYEAKRQGRGRIHFFDADHDRSVQSRYLLVENVRAALDAGDLQLYFQPKVDLREFRVVGMEALLRWQHPLRGILSPPQFLDELGNADILIDIGEWVIDESLRQMTIWQQDGLLLPVSVNTCARQLVHPDFVGYVRDRLAQYSTLPPGSLEIEILETDALKDIGQVCRVLESCHAMGVTFAIDDFGTGYSSLSYLKNIPASTLKIDKSFVISMLDDPDARAIIEGVVQLGKVFGRKVVAEGVETPRHCLALLDLGCWIGQGFGIGRPMEADAVPGWVRDWERKAGERPLEAMTNGA
jgi:diguanylate cyclase (GGDEF)-like protein/PAS domain S-box-containing protein